jgi:type VI secretion system ImpB/VipA family protein
MSQFNDSVEINLSTDESSSVREMPPYRILMLGDFAGGDHGTVHSKLNEGVVEVNSTSFAEVMTNASPAISFTAKNPLTRASEMVAINIGFSSIRDFEPKAVIQACEPLRELHDARALIVRGLRGELAADQVASQVAAVLDGHAAKSVVIERLQTRPSNSPAAASANEIDQLLTELDLGPSTPKETSRPDGTAADLTARATQATQADAAASKEMRQALMEVDACIGKWLSAVLSSTPFRSVESAWRSVDHLVRHFDSRRGIRLSVLHAPFDQVTDRFRECVIDPAFDDGVPAPDLVVMIGNVENTAPQMETLDALAANAASLPAVLMCNVASSFFGMSFAWQIASLPPIRNMFDQWQFAKWNGLRAKGHAHCIGVFAGRSLLRAPYEIGSSGSDLELRFNETAIGEKDFLWAPAPLAAARAVANAVASTGWPVALVGGEFDRVGGFSMGLGGKNGDKPIGPGDIQVPGARLEEFVGVGINIINNVQGSPDAWIAGAVCAQAGAKNAGGVSPDRTLTHQLVATRLANLLLGIKEANPSLNSDELAALIQQSATAWIPASWRSEDGGGVLSVTTRTEGDDSRLTVSLHLPAGVLPGDLPVTMDF